ncbi:competence/damage-inducible protein A [bacterium SCSIO 12741]|nr:competence/damage-inducible protein A [bacterium SCSIO 12741]
MNAEIITIGDELLIGQIVDTNSAWMADRLHDVGITVFQITSIQDDPGHIKDALDLAQTRADIILMTGGLGPTKDDLTKKTLASYFNDTMRFDEEVYEHVGQLFDRLGVKMPPVNRHQAEVPSKCTVLKNEKGTAPGMWFDEKGKIVVSMPGVPNEMRYLMDEEVIPRIKEKYQTPELVYQTVLTQGIGESSLMEVIDDWEEEVLADGIKLAWLPSVGQVRLRLSARGDDREEILTRIDAHIQKLSTLIPDYFMGTLEGAPEKKLKQILESSGLTVSVAESLTGGFVAHLITTVSGSSAYFKGSVTSYSPEVKQSVLGVKEAAIREYTPVSQEVVEQMALGVKKLLQSDFSVATSGVAGPGEDSDGNPPGKVWMAVASPNGVVSREFRFGNDRSKNIIKSSQTALHFLCQEILNN